MALTLQYSLRYKIDMSYKGKDSQVGLSKIYLDEKEAEKQGKRAGLEKALEILWTAYKKYSNEGFSEAIARIEKEIKKQ
jgi:hypothetical protein